MPDEPLPEGAGHRRGDPEVVRSSGCVVPDEEARDRWSAAARRRLRHPPRACTSSRASARRRARRSTPRSARGGPFRSLADLVARTELSEEVVERLIRAGALDSLGRAAPRAAVAAARGRWRGARTSDGRRSAREGAGRPLDLRLPPTAGARPAATDRARAPGRRLRDPLARRAPAGDRAVPPGARRLGVLTRRRARRRDSRAGSAIGGLVVTRQHPMTARGTVFLALEDETGMVNVTLWPDTWARFRRPCGATRCSTSRASSKRESDVVNVVAASGRGRSPRSCRAAGGPVQPQGVRHMGHAGMRRLGVGRADRDPLHDWVSPSVDRTARPGRRQGLRSCGLPVTQRAGRARRAGRSP